MDVIVVVMAAVVVDWTTRVTVRLVNSVKVMVSVEVTVKTKVTTPGSEGQHPEQAHAPCPLTTDVSRRPSSKKRERRENPLAKYMLAKSPGPLYIYLAQ